MLLRDTSVLAQTAAEAGKQLLEKVVTFLTREAGALVLKGWLEAGRKFVQRE